jgi:hypothetical protein
MPETAINTKSATGCLLVLIPAALTMSALFVAWPVILGVTVLIAGGNIWQNHEWSKMTRSIDPVFQQLIVQNRGEITPLDLALTANVSGAVSNRYLVAKADEFGTGRRQHPARGEVYYFVSVTTLGQIFDDSEPETPELMPAASPIVAIEPPAISKEPIPELLSQSHSRFEPVTTTVTASFQVEREPTTSLVESPQYPVTLDPTNLSQSLEERTEVATAPIGVELESLPISRSSVEIEPMSIAQPPAEPPAPSPTTIIIQSELAKRLDVHSSTVYKRRSEPNFTDWTRNRDPEGIGWGYAEATKEYYRVDT